MVSIIQMQFTPQACFPVSTYQTALQLIKYLILH